ncbi:NADPH-dependent FMN reductase [Gracilibacillus dipsosauri]|uniref:NADPH-dependent FMN reductase n=1 Tax=Gracilibacillus dipsosauri TaxID=178340 RepID=A0A317L4J2_9BACI|nr:NAD(P)H-dependent oxidoreductase [Gracilibacillus dipsosauri]PWU70423.1 NADPH-dependent FMN reductase [Gracilibacillus dipsosauri]
MIKIAIIIGSTRPGRKGEQVAEWVYNLAQQRSDALFKLVDVADYQLPLLDESKAAIFGQYSKSHTKRWSKAIEDCDGFIFVTPEYNHATSGALKNAIDYLYNEWNHKAAGFISYGGNGGVRAVENLRLIMGGLMVADVRTQVALSLINDFENFNELKPTSYQIDALHELIDEVIKWSNALKTLRA